MRPQFILFGCFISSLLVMIAGCDHGLKPEEDIFLSGFDGTVTLVEGWPEDSEVRMLYVFVFENIPLDSSDAVNQFFQGKIHFDELIPPFQNEYDYSFDIAPGSYELVACIGVRGANFFDLSTWVLSGIFTETGNPLEPSPVTILSDERRSHVDIHASVIHPLPLPF